jgi:hypothetical protein
LDKKFKTHLGAKSYNEGSTAKKALSGFGGGDRALEVADCFRRRRFYTKKMVNSKKILVTTESHEIYILRNTREVSLRAPCSGCAEETEFLTIDEAVRVSHRPTVELVEQSRIGILHSIEAASGHLLICQRSLSEISTVKG